MSEAETPPVRDVPVDWEALEDAFENNAPEVHSYLHIVSGEVLRVVDGVADPQMHVRIAADGQYLRIDPVSSREQYRWMERYIPVVEDEDLRGKLGQAIDGKGAFRRFKDVLMSFAAERERWFVFRSERLRTFMEAWLTAHAIHATPRPQWVDASPSELAVDPSSVSLEVPASQAAVDTSEGPKSSGRRPRSAEALRQQLREIIEAVGPKELDTLVSFAEFLKARRAARGFAHHYEQLREPRERTLRDEGRDDANNDGTESHDDGPVTEAGPGLGSPIAAASGTTLVGDTLVGVTLIGDALVGDTLIGDPGNRH